MLVLEHVFYILVRLAEVTTMHSFPATVALGDGQRLVLRDSLIGEGEDVACYVSEEGLFLLLYPRHSSSLGLHVCVSHIDRRPTPREANFVYQALFPPGSQAIMMVPEVPYETGKDSKPYIIHLWEASHSNHIGHGHSLDTY